MARNTPFRALRAAAITVLLVLSASFVTAQSSIRVRVDHVNVWNRGFATVATVVGIGTILEVVARRGNWYEVVIPGPPWQPRTTGFIAVSSVETAEDGTPVPTTPGRDLPSPPQNRSPQRAPAPTNPSRPAQPNSTTATSSNQRSTLRLFGEVGYGWFNASQSFEAVLGNSGRPWFGGGVRYASGSGYFVEGSVERFQSEGERVFVVNDTVYKLGITDSLSITPLMGTGGYEFRARQLTTYVGGGVGAYLFRETSDFAEDSDNVSQTSAAYRVLGGVHWPIAKRYSAGLELQYTTVPDALTAGAAQAFDESNLGGLQLKARFAFGR